MTRQGSWDLPPPDNPFTPHIYPLHPPTSPQINAWTPTFISVHVSFLTSHCPHSHYPNVVFLESSTFKFGYGIVWHHPGSSMVLLSLGYLFHILSSSLHLFFIHVFPLVLPPLDIWSSLCCLLHHPPYYFHYPYRVQPILPRSSNPHGSQCQ